MGDSQIRFPGEYVNSQFFLSKNGEKTFQHDESLPALPVPELKSTLDKYLESGKDFLLMSNDSENEWSELSKLPQIYQFSFWSQIINLRLGFRPWV